MAKSTARASAGRLVLAMMLLAALSACGTTPNRPERLARSSYGCMTAVLRQKLPASLPDKHAHCLASGLIARYCSVPEAYLAGIGKEVRDAFTGGDVEWADWRADRIGVGCAHHSADDEALAVCCDANVPAGLQYDHDAERAKLEKPP
jgi:hypothetical protein